MKLIPVDRYSQAHRDVLWALLKSRPEIACVSHKEMPTRSEHDTFVATHPYHDWCLVDVDGEIAGSVFISQPARPSVVGDELSIDLFEHFWGYGYATEALTLMMQRHPRDRYIANVAPNNPKSRALFERLGFKHCQDTLELVGAHDSAQQSPDSP